MSTEVVYLERCFRLLHGWFRVKLCCLSALYAYNHAPVYSFVQSHLLRIRVCLAVTCHLHFWHNDQDLLCATAVTREWNGYWNKSQHRKFTPEKKILLPLLQGFKPSTFRSWVWCSNHRAIPATNWGILTNNKWKNENKTLKEITHQSLSFSVSICPETGYFELQ